jgi:hypothetical protein
LADPHGSNRVTGDGLSRREMLRRAIIVGGTLVWAAPAIQTLSPPAYADVSPGISTCCQCKKQGGPGPSRQCFANDPTADTDAECTTKCAGLAGNYVKEEFHQDFPVGSGNSFSCTGGNDSQCTPDPH